MTDSNRPPVPGKTLPSRRDVLLGGGLVFAISLGGSGAWAKLSGNRPFRKLSMDDVQRALDAGTKLDAFAPNAYIRVTRAGEIFFIIPNAEMGQGIFTGESMLLAEELEVGLDQVMVMASPPNDQLYGSPAFPMQNTGGSLSTMGNWEQLRTAGAAARTLLVQAAAQHWGVPAAECSTSRGIIRHAGTGRTLTFGDVADAAAALTPPTQVPLKSPDQFTLIGKEIPRVDTVAKVNGSLKFGIDMKVPGMKVAVMKACPYRAGSVAAVDSARALKVPGVIQVVRLPHGVAVVGEHFWAARRGAEELDVQWNPGVNRGLSSAQLWKEHLDACTNGPGAVAVEEGHLAEAMKASATQLQAEYRQPFLCHAPMEPVSTIAHVRADSAEVWSGSQVPTRTRAHVAQFLGIAPEKVLFHNVPMGGSFGRRLETDFVLEAVAVAKACAFPVKLIWTREDDVKRDNFRPMYVDRISAGLDSAGLPVAWDHRVTAGSVIARYFPDMMRPNGVDFDAVVEAENPVYGKFPNMRVDFVQPRLPPELIVSTVRGSGAAANQFVIESFVDELAYAAKTDPLDYRRRLAKGVPRALAVLEKAAKESNWGGALPARTGRGVSVQKAFGSFLAVVVEVNVSEAGDVRLQRVTAAVDCGQVVNPMLVRQQIEGGILFGLSSAMFQEITFEAGQVQQGNFNDYRSLRLNETPPVAVHILPSKESPGGIGECGSSAAPPALLNAIFAATRVRIREAPVLRASLSTSAT